MADDGTRRDGAEEWMNYRLTWSSDRGGTYAIGRSYLGRSWEAEAHSLRLLLPGRRHGGYTVNNNVVACTAQPKSV